MAEKLNVFERFAATMKDIGAVSKSQRNTQQNFNYRGIDDVYNAVQNAMADNGLIAVPYVVQHEVEERKERSGAPLFHHKLTVDYVFYGASGDCLPFPVRIIGEAMDNRDKGINKALAIADKYCLLQCFKIPTEELKKIDPDGHTPEPASKKTKKSEPKVEEAEPERTEPELEKYTQDQADEMAQLAKQLGWKGKVLSDKVKQITGQAIDQMSTDDAVKLITEMENTILAEVQSAGE